MLIKLSVLLIKNQTQTTANTFILLAFCHRQRIPTPWKAGTVRAEEKPKYTFCTFCAVKTICAKSAKNANHKKERAGCRSVPERIPRRRRKRSDMMQRARAEPPGKPLLFSVFSVPIRADQNHGHGNKWQSFHLYQREQTRPQASRSEPGKWHK